MRSAKLVLAQVAALLAATCAEPPFGGITTLQPFAVVSNDVWSGSTLTLTSAGFSGTLPTSVLLGNTPLTVTRLDDTTLIATLPDHPGTHTLRVVAATVLPAGIVVYLRGFVEHLEGPEFSGRTEPALDARHLFGNGPASLRRWNVATNKTQDYGDTIHAVGCTRGVGPGPGTGQLVLRRECDAARWMVWRTEPLGALPDTAAATTDRFVAVLAPGRWVVVRNEDFLAVRCDGGSCSTQSIAGTGGSDVMRSPRGDRAALVAHVTGVAGTDGAPVIDVALGSVGYHVAALRSAQGAAFSRTGDTLFLAGDSGSVSRLVAVRAGDGAPVASRDLEFAACALAVDPVQPWLYVAGMSRLQIFDLRTLTAITTLHVTAGGGATFGDNFCRILPNPIDHSVNVAETWLREVDLPVRGHLFRFATP
jgi:hypothetical protein